MASYSFEVNKEYLNKTSASPKSPANNAFLIFSISCPLAAYCTFLQFLSEKHHSLLAKFVRKSIVKTTLTFVGAECFF